MIGTVCMVFVDNWEVCGDSDMDVHIFNEKRMERASQNLLRDIVI